MQNMPLKNKHVRLIFPKLHLHRSDHTISALRLVFFVVVFAAIGTYILISSFADSAQVINSLQAEQMTLPKSAEIIHNSDDSNGEHVRFDAAGTATGTVTIPQYDTLTNVDVRMEARSCHGNPSFNISVNNHSIASSSNFTDNNWNTYSYNDSLQAGTYPVSISTTNDQFYSNSCIRALKVDDLTFYGSVNTPQQPTLAFSASPSAVNSGGSSTLSWSSTYATYCVASGAWSGNEATSGSASTGALSNSETYGLKCSNTVGSVTQSVTVTVNPNSGGGGGGPQPTTLFDSSDGSVPYLTSVIPANPVLDPNSSNMVNSIGSSTPEIADGSQWTIPIYNTSNSDPDYNPSFDKPWGCSVGGSMHIPSFATREAPDASTGGDGWLATVNTDTNTVDAIWQATKSGTWSASCGGSYPLDGNGFQVGEAHPSEVVGVGAGAGEQIGAGVILYSELESGAINHALYMTSTATCASTINNVTTFRVPASKSDGQDQNNSNCWPEGARLQLNPNVNCNGLSGATTGEIMICKTLQTYGAYVLDSGGSGPLSGISVLGDDMTDPGRSPWQTPGDASRGGNNCTPLSATCGVAAHYGLANGNSTLAQIPWSQVRVLANWNGQ
jgi:hypothetical protein